MAESTEKNDDKQQPNKKSFSVFKFEEEKKDEGGEDDIRKAKLEKLKRILELMIKGHIMCMEMWLNDLQNYEEWASADCNAKETYLDQIADIVHWDCKYNIDLIASGEWKNEDESNWAISKK